MDHPLSGLWLTWLTISWGRGATGNLRGPVACREWRAVDVMRLGWLLPFNLLPMTPWLSISPSFSLSHFFFPPLSLSLASSPALSAYIHILYCKCFFLLIVHLPSSFGLARIVFWDSPAARCTLFQISARSHWLAISTVFLILLPPAPQRLELFAKVHQGWEEIHSLSFLMFSRVRGFS